jgi:leucyl aminopeptidase (aminopeptidase T)
MISTDLLQKGVRTCWETCLHAAPGERCLVVTDEELVDLARLFLREAIGMGLDVTLVDLGYLVRDGEEPAFAVAEAMFRADCGLLITAKSMTHTRARSAATLNGTRLASMPMLTPDIVCGPLVADYQEIARVSELMADRLTRASSATITSPRGTELTLRLDGRTALADTGNLSQPGSFGNLPAGEALIAPLENAANGRVVIDGTVVGVGVPRVPIGLTVVEGRIVDIDGAAEADALRDLLSAADRNAFRVAELGIGTNPHARLSGHPLVDEKVLGTAHIGLGNNLYFGGAQDSVTHLDLVILQPTLVLDEESVLVDGKVVVP